MQTNYIETLASTLQVYLSIYLYYLLTCRYIMAEISDYLLQLTALLLFSLRTSISLTNCWFYLLQTSAASASHHSSPYALLDIHLSRVTSVTSIKHQRSHSTSVATVQVLYFTSLLSNSSRLLLLFRQGSQASRNMRDSPAFSSFVTQKFLIATVYFTLHHLQIVADSDQASRNMLDSPAF